MTSKTRAVAIACAATLAALVASPSVAATPSDQERASNTYQTYRGATGCVQDLGYGRIVEGCD